MTTPIRFTAGLFAAALTLAPAAYADDFNPPPWDRNDPFATSAEWDFVQPPDDSNNNNFLGDEDWTPDGSEVPFNDGNSPAVTKLNFEEGIIWDSELGGLVNIQEGAPAEIIITFDNIIDDRPIKNLRIRITGIAGSSITDPIANDLVRVEGFDATDGLVTAQRVSSGFTSLTGDPAFSWGQDWVLEPNPDSETIFIPINPNTAIEQIVVDAISIPEPSTLALLGLGGLAMARRRG